MSEHHETIMKKITASIALVDSAAVLGANDGIVSVASIIVGVSAAGTSTSGIMLAGTAGLVAGACAMAAGEYVSVKSQRIPNAPILPWKQKPSRNIQKRKCRS